MDALAESEEVVERPQHTCPGLLGERRQAVVQSLEAVEVHRIRAQTLEPLRELLPHVRTRERTTEPRAGKPRATDGVRLLTSGDTEFDINTSASESTGELPHVQIHTTPGKGRQRISHEEEPHGLTLPRPGSGGTMSLRTFEGNPPP